MVPVSWALASAEVNAGTASAARIAIIAITTSNSISVNAEEGLFIFSFILGFLFLRCSEGFLAQRVLFGGSTFAQGLRRTSFLRFCFGCLLVCLGSAFAQGF